MEKLNPDGVRVVGCFMYGVLVPGSDGRMTKVVVVVVAVVAVVVVMVWYRFYVFLIWPYLCVVIGE